MWGLWLLAVLLTAPAESQEGVEQGRELYSELCAVCHGQEGRGDGPSAERLGFRPRDFTLGAFKCRSTPSGSPPTDDDLARVIRNGLPGTAMLGFSRRLQPGDDVALVSYLKTLAPALGDEHERKVVAVPSPPEFTDGMKREGRAVYGLLRCWTCHGVDGKGKGPAAGGLEDDWGAPIGVYDFTRRRRYRCGGGDEDLYRTLHTGLSGSPMASFTDAFPFGSDLVGDPAALEGALGSEAVTLLRDWVAEQPTMESIAGMSPEERQALLERRTWSLIAYLRSLEAPGRVAR